MNKEQNTPYNYDQWFSSLTPNTKCMAAYEGSWYEAIIIETNNNAEWVKITYPSWGSSWDEKIEKSSNRLRPLTIENSEVVDEQNFLDNLAIGQQLLAESEGAWYKVEITNINGPTVTVTWLGWNSSFDEDIDMYSNRLKPLDSEHGEQYGTQNGQLNLDDICNNMIENFEELTNYIRGLEKANTLLKARIENIEKKMNINISKTNS
ncbi:hypothetical protein TPENAI_50142 [Tenacibaculum litopenaei]|uniref:hypothetical protein n=1 Tax=Tenacibaculum litopenaei TaxID=396016 RepID=UPI003895E88E